MRKRRKMPEFQVQKYAENLAWKAFLKSKDPALELQDFLQEARMVLIKAAREYNFDRGAKLSSYSIAKLIGRFKHMEREFRHLPQTIAVDQLPEVSKVPDNFWLRVVDVLASKGNEKAKALLRTLLNHYRNLSRCSLADLQRVSGMSDKDMRAALFQLSRY